MTARKKYWLLGIGVVLGLTIAAAFIAASVISKRFEPMIRQQAIQYLQQRFNSEVELSALRIHRPKLSVWDVVMRQGRGVFVSAEADGLSMRFGGSHELPPLFSIRRVRFVVDLGVLTQPHKEVEAVSIDGMEIHIPPKGDSSRTPSASLNKLIDVDIKDIKVRDATLVILPKDKSKEPLKFNIGQLHLKSAGGQSAMSYDAAMTIPKPNGMLHSEGTFGPWSAAEPGDTPLHGKYTFDHADLGVFKGIAGILGSIGSFEGTLDSVNARGEASVPDFRLDMGGNPVPLWTQFEVLVDGTNGDTVLKPVKAKLGSTYFTTTGAVINHEKESRHSINLDVTMPHGDIRDLLRLAMKGDPFLEGEIALRANIDIPPLGELVKEKLRLKGTFDLHDAKFLRSTIQDQIDQLSRRGQGQPKNEEIDEVVSNMKGAFQLANQDLSFRTLSFDVPGAKVDLAGDYNLFKDTLDFHGTLKLDARVSQTMTGWKRVVLKPVDPFFAKNGAGTFLRIKVDGSARKPSFGLDHAKQTEAKP